MWTLETVIISYNFMLILGCKSAKRLDIILRINV
jgi:hypothetical protein